MNPFMLPQDYKEIARRERHRQIEIERRQRIFNAKARLIGIDQESLQKQIDEKKERLRKEKLEEELYDKKQAQDNNIVAQRMREMEADKQREILELNQYRVQFQKFQDRREADLNDPKQYKLLPEEMDESYYGPASMRKFEGSDEANVARVRLQEEQRQAWLQQQMRERREQKAQKQQADLAYDKAQMATTERYRALKQIEDKCKAELQAQTAQFNKEMAFKKIQDRITELKLEMADDEITNMNVMSSDMLCENKDTAASGLGQKRIIGTNYKGLSNADLAEIRRIQLEQIAEKKARAREEDVKDQAWIQYQLNIQSTVQDMDEKKALTAKEKEAALRQENKKLWEEQKQRKEYLDKYVYVNRPTSDYFNQFNTSTR